MKGDDFVVFSNVFYRIDRYIFNNKIKRLNYIIILEPITLSITK